MLQYGVDITKYGDKLHKIPVDGIFRGISQSKPVLRDKIVRLRILKTIDEKQYRKLKTTLPYFVCGIFHPMIRRKENFAAIEYFMLDLDHLDEYLLNIEDLVERLKQNSEIVMMFVSPSGGGLKIMFRLENKCTDSALFSSFYKIFAYQFAQKNQLTEVVDLKTSDVTRACFLSHDANAYFNPDASRIIMDDYISSMDYGQATKEIKEVDNWIEEKANEKPIEKTSLSDDVLAKIKSKLNPKARPKKQKHYIASPQVEELLPNLIEQLENYNIHFVASQGINYGKKVKISAEKLWAEINIFYGKKGWSVIKTTKTGSNGELADLGVHAILEILADLETDISEGDG